MQSTDCCGRGVPADCEPLVLARRTAMRVRARLNLPPVPLDDLVGDACLGLVEAGEHYEPERGVPFAAFARQRMEGAIVDGIRRRGLRRAAWAALQAGERIADVPATTTWSPSPEGVAAGRQAWRLVAQALAVLDREERDLLTRLYGLHREAEPAAAVARRLGVHRSTIRRRHDAVLEKLRAHLLLSA